MNGDKLVPPTELATWIKGRLADVNTELGHLDTQTWDWERDRVTTIPIPAGAGAVAGGVTAVVGVDDLQLSRALSWHLAYALPQLVCEGERPDGTPTPGCVALLSTLDYLLVVGRRAHTAACAASGACTTTIEWW